MFIPLTGRFAFACFLLAFATTASVLQAQVVSPEVRDDGSVICRVHLGDTAMVGVVRGGGL